ncbi:MAG: type IX secretion system protein PorQ [Bacteroidales bacterium]|nr:type IX secretion system protein PorQ [Bacteroidales bacterium]
MKLYTVFSLSLLFGSFADSLCQVGGKAFQFLEMTNSARIAALGGKSVSIYDNDLNITYYNPSILSEGMNNHLVLNYVNFFAGINYGYASYAKSIDKIGNFAAGIHYQNYGTFTGADINGRKTSDFHAAEYAFGLIYSRKIDSLLQIGVNLKPLYSSLETYSSFAIAVDAGITYHNPDKMFTASLVIRNLGTQLSTYYPDGEYESLPFDIAIGISKGLKHAPFKFYIIADHLEKFDLTYTTEKEEEKAQDAFTEELSTDNRFDVTMDKVMRHFIFGTELNITRNFMLRFGYNYRRRQEMKIESKPGTIGFSWGLGIKISKFHFSYGRSAFHLAGSPNYFSLSMNLSEFYKKF